MGNVSELTFDDLKKAVSGSAAAFRCVTEYQPVGGEGDKIFPPTYSGGKYATETRVIGGKSIPCVLLNSVQSEANHMELALRDAWEDISNGKRRIELPVVRTTFNLEINGVKKIIPVTSLDAPHRIADAIFRDSYYRENDNKNIMFRKSSKGQVLDMADLYNAAELFGLCPTALLFGMWDAAGPRGGLGAKFQRAIVSEMVGIGAQPGVTTGGKVDRLNIVKEAGTLYEREKKSDSLPDWTFEEALAAKDREKFIKMGKNGKGRPSDANLGGVTPDIAFAKDSKGNNIRESDGTFRIKGGFSIEKARRTTVLSLVALRRLRFPLNGKGQGEQIIANQAARTVLAALGLCAATLVREQGADLRSRCQLFPTGPFIWDLLNEPAKESEHFTLSAENAIEFLNRAVIDAKEKGLPWEDVIELTPSEELSNLVKKSQEVAAKGEETEEVEEGEEAEEGKE